MVTIEYSPPELPVDVRAEGLNLGPKNLRLDLHLRPQRLQLPPQLLRRDAEVSLRDQIALNRLLSVCATASAWDSVKPASQNARAAFSALITEPPFMRLGG